MLLEHERLFVVCNEYCKNKEFVNNDVCLRGAERVSNIFLEYHST